MHRKDIEFINSKPNEIKKLVMENPIVYVPFGALEWHGEHNVVGVDSIKASYICKKCIEITGGVLFPCVNYGAFDTMRFPFTLQFKKRRLKRITKKMANQLYEMGFQIIIFLTGHYPRSQINSLKKVSQKISKKYQDCFALGIPEYYLVPDLDYFGDHAAEWETSIMLAIDENLVDLNNLPTNLSFSERAQEHGILGKDPHIYASKEKGEKILTQIIRRLTTAVLEVQNTDSMQPFDDIYSNFETIKSQHTSIKEIFRIYGVENKKQGFEYLKWLIFRRKKYNPK
jgi:creatinine amidohydrolase